MTTFAASPVALINNIHKDQFVTSTVSQSQASVAVQRTAASLQKSLLICCASSTATEFLTDLMELHHLLLLLDGNGCRFDMLS